MDRRSKLAAPLTLAALLFAPPAVSPQIAANGVHPQSTAELPPLERRVTLRLRQVTLEAALHEIERQSGARLLYSRTFVPLGRLVSVDAARISVAEALRLVLRDTGIVAGAGAVGSVVLERADDGSHQRTRAGSVVGRVSDAKTGQAVPAADVWLEGSRWRSTTDSSGRYRLAEVDSEVYTLAVRRLGYTKFSRRITVGGDRTDTVDVALAPAPVKLDELITTATGVQRRRDIGNAITTIKADSVMQTAPIRTLTDLLANRVPGLTVQHTSGAPGDPARLRLRGLGSAFRSNDPVVVVDGVRIYAAQSGARSGNLTNLDPGRDTVVDGGIHQRVRANPVDVPAPSPLDQIDPNIIEKIEVFKGPSAATLYGADAANGVIVITTKRGKPGPTRWNASFEHGRTITPGGYPTGYYRWGHDIFRGSTRFCTLTDVRCRQDSLVRFQALNDPALTVLGRGHYTSLSLTASGGSQALTYSVTGTYGGETGLLKLPDFEVERFRAHFNRQAPNWMRRPHQLDTWGVTSAVTARLGATADVTLSTRLTRSEQQRTSLEQQVAPLAGTYIDRVNGLYYRPVNQVLDGQVLGYTLNATADALRDYYVRQTASTITFTSGLATNWRPRPWVTATANAGVDVIPRADQLVLPSGLVAATDSGAVTRATGRSLVGTFNVQGTVQRPLGLGFHFVTNLGANLTTTTTNDLATSASRLQPGTTSLNGARVITAAEQASNTSVFGWYLEPAVRGERLSVSLGLRLDGGSAYGARLSRGSGLLGLLALPKLGGAWVVSEEPWFPFGSLFSSLRLRGAYGQAQVQPEPKDRLRLYTGSVTEQGSELALTTLGNGGLRPERSTEFEGGFDADLLDGRLSVELTAYRKLQVDMLMPITLPGSAHGGGTVLTNVGNVRNRGLELTFGLTPVRRPGITWHTELQYARNSNTLVKLGRGVDANKAAGLVEGYPLYSRWARPIVTYADQNADGVLQPEEIQVGDSLAYMGRLQPAYEAVLFTNLSLFGGTVGVNAGLSYDAGQTQIDQTARTNWVLNRALVDPAVPLGAQAAVLASTRIEDPTDYGLMHQISTFRFTSLSVNYTLPSRLAHLLRAERASVALQGSNLALHSTYPGKDPDVSAWSPGEGIVDTGQLPQPRRWQLAVRLDF